VLRPTFETTRDSVRELIGKQMDALARQFNFLHAGLGELGPEGRSREFPLRIRRRAGTAAFRCTSATSKRPTLPGVSALLQTRKLIHKLIHKMGGRLGTS